MFKTLLALLAALLLVPSVAAAQDGDDGEVVRILIVPDNGPWYIQFKPDGSADARLKADPTVAATLPAGTVDFDALASAVRRLRAVDGGPKCRTNAGLLASGADNANGFYLSDDTLVRYLVASFRPRWQADDRSRAALEAQPMFPDDG